MEKPILRRLQVADLAECLRLTQAERWSHRIEDWEFAHRLGLGWAACDAEGKLLGTASWWAYGERFATVGLVLVDQNYQGRGIGRQLMDAVIREAGARTLQLVATKAGLTLYQRCGFREQYGIGQHQGMVGEIPASELPSDTTLRAVSHADLGALCVLDAAASGGDRHHLVNAVLDSGTGVLALRGGQPIGFALARKSGRGTVIGPVVAPDESLATALIAHHLMNNRGEFVRVDIPTDTAQLAVWLERAGLACVDRVAVMVRGEVPERNPSVRVFALVSQALN